ncbi:MAG: tetratricopeptide repeat protein [bacterium]
MFRSIIPASVEFKVKTVYFCGLKMEEGGLAIPSNIDTLSFLRKKHGALLPKELMNALPEERGALCLEYSHLLTSLLRAAGIEAHIKQEPTHAYVIAQLGGQKYKLDIMALQFNNTDETWDTDRESLSKHYSNEGAILASQGKYDEAIRAYNMSLEIDRSNATAYYNKGFALKEQGEIKKAIDAYSEALKIDPSNIEVWHKKGLALLNQGKINEAVEAFNRGLQLEPSNLPVLIVLDKVIEGCQKALEIDPMDADKWYTLGLALTAQGRFTKAINVYNKVLEINPNNAIVLSSKKTTFYRQVVLRYENGETDKTIEACNRALEIKLAADDVLSYDKDDLTQQTKPKIAMKCFEHATEYLQKR